MKESLMKKFLAASFVLLVTTLAIFQQTLTRAQQGAPPRRMNIGIEEMTLDDHTGFESIFDGSSLKGWDGDPQFWRVENGAIIGESTAEKPVKQNTFLIWRGGQPKDFELKLEYRMNSTNSGIQYRSVELPDVGKTLAAEQEAAVVESVKAASDVYAPIAGLVTEVNTAVSDSPESVNEDAYAAWLFKMKPANAADVDALLDAAEYSASAGE